MNANAIVRRLSRRLGYEVIAYQKPGREPIGKQIDPVEPVWSLPYSGNIPADAFCEVARSFAEWHYDFQFDNGLKLSDVVGGRKMSVANLQVDRPIRRFRHFFPQLLASCGGSLQGRRVLDIACNSGFWSLQCALMGAEVVGFDARPELIEQAELITNAVGPPVQPQFRTLDFWDATPEVLGQFDVVLNLGILYHLPDTLAALKQTMALSNGQVLLDTGVYPLDSPLVYLNWENAEKVVDNADAGVVAIPTRKAVQQMLRHLGVRQVKEIGIGNGTVPPDYLAGTRAAWLIQV